MCFLEQFTLLEVKEVWSKASGFCYTINTGHKLDQWLTTMNIVYYKEQGSCRLEL